MRRFGLELLRNALNNRIKFLTDPLILIKPSLSPHPYYSLISLTDKCGAGEGAQWGGRGGASGGGVDGGWVGAGARRPTRPAGRGTRRRHQTQERESRPQEELRHVGVEEGRVWVWGKVNPYRRINGLSQNDWLKGGKEGDKKRKERKRKGREIFFLAL